MRSCIPVLMLAAVGLAACSEKPASPPAENAAASGATAAAPAPAPQSAPAPAPSSPSGPGVSPAQGASPAGTSAGPADAPVFTPSPELVKAAAAEKLNIPTDFKADLSGMKFAIEREGSGVQPKEGQTVVVNYIGWLTDGKKFDSSKKGQPFKFKLGKGQVIDGWDLGLAKMKVGSKAWLVLPADLAYGESGSPPEIPANATLVFHIELLGVE